MGRRQARFNEATATVMVRVKRVSIWRVGVVWRGDVMR
jgi:hypothetical protein